MANNDLRCAAARLHCAVVRFEFGEALMRERLRRKHPNAGERELAIRLGRWLCPRPGAEFGDAEGVLRPLQHDTE